ncbi:MAG: 4-hydroxy-tetrahydrodipicolinate reductase [Gammaproteobacteria bacterium]|nr:4-hydroxy-tetrahydrodipicolinate reductase [Gammaproteobacteria bacterium]MYD79307.1 4-hydroxy-tetrahydrodipicolinate reductase [Gammaproteobacteria bacterium]
MIPVAICGATGKMGRMLIAAVHNHPDLSLVGLLASRESSFLESDAGALADCGEIGISVSSEMDAAIGDCRVLIDFSVPDVIQDLTDSCVDRGIGMVIGTTGYSAKQRSSVEEAAESIPIVLSPNMSVGVNVTLKMVELATQAMDSEIDVEIFESHHQYKIDAPSGTAVRLGELIAETRKVDLADVAVYGREGMTGQRNRGSIGFHSARGGDVVGEHTVFFLGEGERVEVSHRATDRSIFANGAAKASVFVAEKLQLGSCGLYDMSDVLGLS